jgi:hypothetical protein
MLTSLLSFTKAQGGVSAIYRPQEKVANHEAAVALHCMHYSFVRIHQTLRVTPAMAAGVTDRLWSVEDIAALLD